MPQNVSESYRLAVQLSDGIGAISLRVALANTPDAMRQVCADLRDAIREAEQLARLMEEGL